jgi:hypothetical protein
VAPEQLISQGINGYINERNEDSDMNLKLYWEKIIEYFEEENWPLYELDDEKRTAVAYTRGDNTTFRFHVWLNELSKTLNLSWLFPSSVSFSRRHVILDLLNELNCRTFMGKFVMYPEGGLLVFRISVNVTGTRFSMGQFDSFIQAGIWTTDEYYPKFMALIYGGDTVDQVLEGKERPQSRLAEKAEEQGALAEILF